MALEAGTRLGHYEVLSSLGAGGMGEVYRARDTKLGREVAIKVLPEGFSDEPESMARFEREAKVLASLNHNNIATLHGFETEGDKQFLVMELVEGETLADRIKRGAIPVDEALPVFLQIAEGLEAAHEKGVIHRDLKPANIKVTDDGHVKILDFGLAKAMAVEAQAAGEAGLSESPTLTLAATRRGQILGTAAYMSPEQARGRVVNKRADLWAFGACLYEALVGNRAFDGTDATDILGSVLNLEPDWGRLPPSLPAAVTRVLHRCLTKDPGRRQRDAGDIRLDLEAALQEGAPGLPSQTSSSGRIIAWIPWVLAAALGIVALGLLMREASPTVGSPRTRRFTLDLPWQNMPNWGDFRVRISPQGTHLAYPGSDENRTIIYLHPLDSLEAVTLVSPIAGPWNLVFSPDGDRLAFFAGLQLNTVSIQGGQPEPLFEAENFVFGLSWGSDGSILLGGEDGLTRVQTSDGEAELVATAQGAEIYQDPFHLPEGDHALVSILRPPSLVRLAVVDLATGTLRELPFQGVEPIYSPTGHILFRHSGELFAVRFDLDAKEARGQAVAFASGVAYGPRLSEDGTLVYVAERADGAARLVWVDRRGTAMAIPGERRDYSHIDLSTEGARALLNTGNDIYASDLDRGTRNLVSSGDVLFPIWHPGGERATFRRGDHVLARMADGSAQEESLLEWILAVPTSWSPDGEYLAFFDRQSDVWMLPREGDPQPFLTGPANERSARFSPDGSALAYVSDESGEFQVYVTPFPGPGPKIPVSIDGGLSPIWSSGGEELYFRQGSKVMAAKVALGREIEVSPPELLFDGPYTLDLSGHQRYDVAPDGRFLMVENSEDFRVVLVENFFEELKRLVPTD